MHSMTNTLTQETSDRPMPHDEVASVHDIDHPCDASTGMGSILQGIVEGWIKLPANPHKGMPPHKNTPVPLIPTELAWREDRYGEPIPEDLL